MDRKLLGRALKAARETRALSQQAVGSAVGVTRQAVGQWERGEDPPSTENLIDTCRYLRIDLEAAIEGRVVFTDDGFADAGRRITEEQRAQLVALMKTMAAQR